VTSVDSQQPSGRTSTRCCRGWNFVVESLESRRMLHGASHFEGGEPGGHHETSNPGVEVSSPALRVVERSNVPLSAFSAGVTRANDIWGYVSASGREYAIIGLKEGTGYVEVTDPDAPVMVGFLPGADEPGGNGNSSFSRAMISTTAARRCHIECGREGSVWRDMKTHGTYAYVSNETFGGIQIIDLTQIDEGLVSILGTVTENGLNTAHNIAVNSDSNTLFVVGGNIHNGGILAFDITEPTTPIMRGTWSNEYIHDIEIVNYTSGPFAGREIAYCFSEGRGVKIVDVTDKNNMVEIAAEVYPHLTYAHYGALSEDRQYLFVNDEKDELLLSDVSTTMTYVLDVSDINNPTYLTSFTNGITAIDHNLEVRGDLLYEVNYRSGLRIFDIRDINNVREIGHYDTYLSSDPIGFDGAWGVYTDLPSGQVLVTDIQSGLFVLDVGQAQAIVDPPRVSQVYVRNSDWSTEFLQGLYVSGSGSALAGYALPDGSNQDGSLPWSEIDTITVQFTEDVSVQPADLIIAGTQVPTYTFDPAHFSYDHSTSSATWVLDNPVVADHLQVTINDRVTDRDAAVDVITLHDNLDGEWIDQVSHYPSGDGLPGGDFQISWNVMPGDVDGNQLVDAADIDKVFYQIGSVDFDPLCDITTSGGVDFEDIDHLVTDILGTRYGDLNLDGFVDTVDLTISMSNYTGPFESQKGWASGDTDGDGDVDTADITRAIQNFTSRKAPSLRPDPSWLPVGEWIPDKRRLRRWATEK